MLFGLRASDTRASQWTVSCGVARCIRNTVIATGVTYSIERKRLCADSALSGARTATVRGQCRLYIYCFDIPRVTCEAQGSPEKCSGSRSALYFPSYSWHISFTPFTRCRCSLYRQPARMASRVSDRTWASDRSWISTSTAPSPKSPRMSTLHIRRLISITPEHRPCKHLLQPLDLAFACNLWSILPLTLCNSSLSAYLEEDHFSPSFPQTIFTGIKVHWSLTYYLSRPF